MERVLSYSEIIKKSWESLKTQFWVLAGLIIGFTIVSLLLAILFTPVENADISLRNIVISILLLAFSYIFKMGYLKNCFQALDGEEPQFSAYGQVFRKLFKYIVAFLIYSIILSIGFALLVFPGIYLMLRLQFYYASIIEENTTIVESFKRSWDITQGHTLELFILFLLSIAIIIAGSILFFIGFFVAIPLVSLIYACAFRKLTKPSTP